MKKAISTFLLVILTVLMSLTAHAAYDLDTAPEGSIIIGSYIFTDGELTTLRVMDAARTIPYGESSVIYQKNSLSSGGKGWDIVTTGIAVPVMNTANVPDGDKIEFANDAPITKPSNDATLTATIGTVDNEAGTITGIPNGTTLADFKAAVTPAAGASFEVYAADGTSVATDLASDYKVTVTAEDTTTKKTYTITVL